MDIMRNLKHAMEGKGKGQINESERIKRKKRRKKASMD